MNLGNWLKINKMDHLSNKKKTLIVIICTIIAMIIQIMYGYATKSMSLLAEGYHMGTHVLTLSLTYIAYVLSEKLSNSARFPLGTNKIGVLAGYTSSIFLGFAGLWIIIESAERFFKPENIEFQEAILIAIFCFVVNAVCITVMKDHHIHLHYHKHEEEHEDYNYKAAYYHILADLITSILTIIALVVGKIYNCIHLDAIVGIICGILIIRWAVILITHTIKILIDMKEE